MSDAVIDLEIIKPAADDLKLQRPEIRPGGVIDVGEEACTHEHKESTLDRAALQQQISRPSEPSNSERASLQTAQTERDRRIAEIAGELGLMENLTACHYIRALEQGDAARIAEAEELLYQALFESIESSMGEECFCRNSNRLSPEVEAQVAQRVERLRRYLAEFDPQRARELFNVDQIRARLDAHSLMSEQRAAMQRFVGLLSAIMPGHARFFEEALLGKKRSRDEHAVREAAKEQLEETTVRGHHRVVEHQVLEEEETEESKLESELVIEDQMEVHEEVKEKMESIEWEIATLEAALEANVNPDQPNLPLSEARRQRLTQRLSELVALLSALRSRDQIS